MKRALTPGQRWLLLGAALVSVFVLLLLAIPAFAQGSFGGGSWGGGGGGGGGGFGGGGGGFSSRRGYSSGGGSAGGGAIAFAVVFALGFLIVVVNSLTSRGGGRGPRAASSSGKITIVQATWGLGGNIAEWQKRLNGLAESPKLGHDAGLLDVLEELCVRLKTSLPEIDHAALTTTLLPSVSGAQAAFSRMASAERNRADGPSSAASSSRVKVDNWGSDTAAKTSSPKAYGQRLVVTVIVAMRNQALHGHALTRRPHIEHLLNILPAHARNGFMALEVFWHPEAQSDGRMNVETMRRLYPDLKHFPSVEEG